MIKTASRTLLPKSRKIDLSIFNMSISSFYERYLMGDSNFRAEFLEHKVKGTKIGHMTVHEFVSTISTEQIVKERCFIGKTSVAKIRAQLVKSGIEWK